MKILLLNNNPVVNKLVTLSVQKTSDNLSTADSIEAVESGDYDVLILDDAFYGEETLQELSSKINYKESLYICSRDAKGTDRFSKVLKKPFLPTDLVEMLISLSKMVDTVELDKISKTHSSHEAKESLAELEDFEGLDELGSLDELDNLDELEELDEEPHTKSELEELNFDDMDDLEDGIDKLDGLDEEMELEEFEENQDDEGFEELEDIGDDDSLMEGVLDKDELQEVQNLLEETEMEESFDFDEDDLELEGLEETNEQESEIEETLSEEMELEETLGEVKEEMGEEELGFDDSDLELGDDFEDGILSDDEEALETPKAQDDDENYEDLASQIETAVQALSDEDLQMEVDEDLLLNIGSLTSRDLKLAIGEEVDEEELDDAAKEIEFCEDEAEEELVQDSDDELSVEDEKPSEAQKNVDSGNSGVEALKKLLKALSNEDVAASLKGMRININITLGDE